MKTNDQLFEIKTERAIEITLQLLLFIAEGLKTKLTVSLSSAVQHILSKDYTKNEAAMLCYIIGRSNVTLLASLLRAHIDRDGQEKAIIEFKGIIAERYNTTKQENQN